MSLITFFQECIKPYKLRGAGIINPIKTSIINENLSCIRQNDVNLFIYTKNNTSIAIDAGYKNDLNLLSELEELNIKNEGIQSVFITHGDIDHVGGLLSKERFAPKACVYIHEFEEDMILGREKRFKFGIFKLKNPVIFEGRYTKLIDKEVIEISGIKIECFHTPGHTRGHSCYLVDDRYLFTGDSIAVNENGGYCFFDFYNMNTKENIASLNYLKTTIEDKNIEVFTSHNGTQEAKRAFLNINKVAKGTKKLPFDSAAPHDPFVK